MPAEKEDNLRLEIGHVLFLDIVGYSKLLINEQTELTEHLKGMVRDSPEAQRAHEDGKLIRLATGDGIALVFLNSPEAPAQCALELSQADKEHPELQLRMGIHSGPINQVTDVNERANVTGAGINTAQRVMDCGDAGHILLSQHVADDLEQYPRWRPLLHSLGDCEVKHGVKLRLVNLYNEQLGNPALPEKLKRSAAAKRGQKSSLLPWLVAALVMALAVIAAAMFWQNARRGSAIVTNAPPPATPAPGAIPEKSIAVLPFENLSDDKQNAYFTDGVQDEILTNLAKIADLKVISRTSVMQYRNEAKRNLREIGQQLGVAHLLEGSVQRVSNKVRVNTQLIDARSDRHEWAENYDRPIDDVFAIQSEIAKTIADQLQAKLSPNEQKAIAQPPTTDLNAYDLYLRARALDDLVDDPNGLTFLEQAVQLLEQAIQRDPNFLLAYSLLSEVHTDIYWGGFDHTPARLEQARVALEKAERIRPDAGEVHYQKGVFAYHGYRDYEGARREFELALRTLPNSSRLALIIGAVDRRQGRWDDAVKNFSRAVDLDPRDSVSLEEAGFTFTRMRRYAEARPMLERAAEVNPNDIYVRAILWSLPYRENADTTTYRSHFDELMRTNPSDAARISSVYLDCALAARDRAEAEKVLRLIPAEGVTDNTLNNHWPREWFVGLVARSFGDLSAARAAFTAARPGAAQVIRDQPDYPAGWLLLGLIDASLGDKANAMAAAARVRELIPISKDAFDGPYYASCLSQLYTWIGEKDLALEELALSAKLPPGVAYGEAKLSPKWDPLRGDPRFDKIVASLAPK